MSQFCRLREKLSADLFALRCSVFLAFFGGMFEHPLTTPDTLWIFLLGKSRKLLSLPDTLGAPSGNPEVHLFDSVWPALSLPRVPSRRSSLSFLSLFVWFNKRYSFMIRAFLDASRHTFGSP